MPELPEVEIVTRGLKPIVEGKKIVKVDVSNVVKQSKLQGKEAIIKGKVTEHFIEEMTNMTYGRYDVAVNTFTFQSKKMKIFIYSSITSA